MKGQNIIMYGISRIDDEVHRTHAWRVSLRRRGQMFVKNFPDKKCGSKRKALQQAKVYRDHILNKYPPITRKEFSSTLRSNNVSGITGVYRYAKKYTLADSSEVECWYWEAHWPTEPGESKSERFSINDYGEDIARAMAIRARERGLAQVQGVYWASERGLKVEETKPSAARSRASLSKRRKKPTAKRNAA